MSTETSSRSPSAARDASPFPLKTALALLVAMAALAGWHAWRRDEGLNPAIFRDAATLHLPHAPHAETPATSSHSAAGAKSAASGVRSAALTPVSEFLIDDGRVLAPLFAALWGLEQRPGGAADVVTILHYGDSPITADLITGDARAMLQTRFGDAGHGFNLPAKPWAWYGHRDVDISDHGWRSLTGVGSMRQGIYGLGGATLVGGSDAHSTFKLRDGGSTATLDLQYLTEPNGGSVTVSADGVQVLTVCTEGDADTSSARRISLPVGTRSIDLTVSGGQVKLFGVDLRTGRSGVLYDSLGLNGASTTVLSRTLAVEQWTEQLRHADPKLVIVNYGTNESSFGAFVHKQYEGELRLAIGKLHTALPGVPILIMSPMDRAERAGLNELRTMSTIPEIVAIQRRVAADTNCAFFDTFHAMGGDGTMARWYALRPRLVSADFIHPTPQGALLVAKLLVDNLDLGYDRWKQEHGIPLNGGPPAMRPPASLASPRLPPESTPRSPQTPPAALLQPVRPAVSPAPSPVPGGSPSNHQQQSRKPSAAQPELPDASTSLSPAASPQAVAAPSDPQELQ